MATLQDIANHVECSVGAVSNILSRKDPRYSKVLHRKVREAAERLEYRPHAGARAMQRGRFNKVAFAINMIGDGRGIGVMPHILGYLEGINSVCMEQGYSFVLAPVGVDKTRDSLVSVPKIFEEASVDGVLVLAANAQVPPDVDNLFQNLGVPVVWLNRNPWETVCGVVCDEAAGAETLTKYLIELGHRRIGYIGFEGEHYSVGGRINGILATLYEAALDTSSVYLRPSESCLAIEEFFTKKPYPSALIIYNGEIYLSFLHAACRRGIRIPEDISVCYFASAWEMGSKTNPTTLVLPEIEMGSRASQILLERMADPSKQGESVLIPGALRKGVTTLPAKNRANMCAEEVLLA